MSKPKIGIVVGSTREGRFAEKPAHWLLELGKKRTELDFEIVDLRDFPLPFFGEQGSPAHVGPANEASAWRKKLAELDGFVVLAAEYNHAPTAVLKNALDHARSEWVRKPIAYAGYGGVGAARAIEQLRMVAIEQQMAPIKSAVHILWPDYMAANNGADLSSMEHLNQAGAAMLADLSWWTIALKNARDAEKSLAKAA